MKLTFPLLPVPAGMDNVHSSGHAQFNVREGERGFEAPAALRAAQNVDVTSDGQLVARSGEERVVGLAAGKRLLARAGRLFVQDGSTLSTLSGSTKTTVLSGLSESLPLHMHVWPPGGTQILLASGTLKRLVLPAAVKSWGLPVPGAVAMAPLAGGMPPGLYLCAATFRDGPVGTATAQESGAVSPAQLELKGEGGFSLSVTTAEAAPTHVSFYLSGPNQPELFRVGTVALSALPSPSTSRSATLAITADEAITETPLLTQDWGAPPPSIGALGSLQSFVLASYGSTLYRSWPGRPGLFDYARALQVFPATVRTIVGLDDGAYVGTDAGLYWLSGPQPEAWRREMVAPIAVIPDGAAISGAAMPALETNARVAVFATGRGLVVGLPGGRVQMLTQNRYHFSASRVSIALNGQQLLVGNVA